MQVIEVDHVVLHGLHAVHEIPDRVGVRRDADAERVLDGAARCHRVHHRADAADALGKSPGVARIAALHDELDATELRRGRPGGGDAPVLVSVQGCDYPPRPRLHGRPHRQQPAPWNNPNAIGYSDADTLADCGEDVDTNAGTYCHAYADRDIHPDHVHG